MKLEFEYGQGTMAANLPDTTEVFIPGKTVLDPACIPEDQLYERPANPYSTRSGCRHFPSWPKRAAK